MPFPPDPEPIRAWAAQQGMLFFAEPQAAWFEAWEPFDTMVAPARYVNSVVATVRSASFVYVEPWTAGEGLEPIDRTLLAFVTHGGLRVRAAARIGEWFLTRVAFVGSIPPHEVRIGDDAWDRKARTYAPLPDHARYAFHPTVRALLDAWRFRGHVELRPGGLVVHVAGIRPIPSDLTQLADFVPRLLDAALAYPSA
jgi:hypothetical protein